jgi:hypothetical protein
MAKFQQGCPNPFETKRPVPNWDGLTEDVTELHYLLTAQNEIDCKIRFTFVITLHFDDGNRTFGPHTKGLLTTEANAQMVRGILDNMRKPYIIFNDHLTAPAGMQAQ